MIREKILSILESQKQVYFNENELLKKVGFVVDYDKKRLKKEIDGLTSAGTMVLSKNRKYALSSRAGLIKGILECNPKGYGFVRPQNGDLEDIFVHERNYNGAVHGDTVLVALAPQNKQRFHGGRQRSNRREDRREGEIISVLQRRIVNIVGLFKNTGAGFIVVPDDQRFTDQVFVDKQDSMGATNNKKVVVKIIDYPTRIKMARGEIIEILGDVGDVGIDTLSIIRSYGLYETFPEDVEAEAENVGIEPTPKDLEGRRDFTQDMTITIDGEDARDFDDAISLKRDKNQDWQLCIHIADVAHYVKKDSRIDEEAFARATSVYFPDHVLPMLPQKLSNDICSLNPGKVRLTLSVVMTLDEDARVKDYEIVNGYIKSKNRMTYTEVTKILEGDEDTSKKYSHLVDMLKNMSDIAQKRIKYLENRGEIDFDMPEVQIDMNDKNEIENIRRKPRTISERLIEQFMIMTNEIVAKHIRLLEVPFVYRVHEIPSTEKLKSFNDFVSGLSLPYTLPESDAKPRDVQKVLRAARETPLGELIATLLLRSMQKAKYDSVPIGHFGLALRDYCHFTAPIRRYADLVIHRIIKLTIAGKLVGRELAFYDEYVDIAALQSSERERLADEVEREVDSLKKTEYMSKRIGEEFDGKISGVVESGFFVQLENTIEGFVGQDYLPEDRYYFDEKKHSYVGQKNIFKLGQKVKISVLRTDLVLRKIDFALVDEMTNKDKK